MIAIIIVSLKKEIKEHEQRRFRSNFFSQKGDMEVDRYIFLLIFDDSTKQDTLKIMVNKFDNCDINNIIESLYCPIRKIFAA